MSFGVFFLCIVLVSNLFWCKWDWEDCMFKDAAGNWVRDKCILFLITSMRGFHLRLTRWRSIPRYLVETRFLYRSKEGEISLPGVIHSPNM